MLAWVYLRPAASGLRSSATAVDIAAISVLAVLSGGAFSHARLAFFLVPVAVAFRFRPSITARRRRRDHGRLRRPGARCTRPRRSRRRRASSSRRPGFLAWVGLACVASLDAARAADGARRPARRGTVASAADALAAEQRERKALAEALHDHAIQNLLSARHELEEAGEAVSHPALDRADAALAETVGQLREAVFELHPYVLEEAGLEAALRSIARAGRESRAASS